MRTSSIQTVSTPVSATALVLRHARRLHRAARSGSLGAALPAIRRVHAAGLFPGQALSALYREREQLQRKHFLRALAIEAGFPDWEQYRPQLDQLPPAAVDHLKVGTEWRGFCHAWFSTEAEARAHADAHGGRVLKVGAQAVVISPEAEAGGAR